MIVFLIYYLLSTVINVIKPLRLSVLYFKLLLFKIVLIYPILLAQKYIFFVKFIYAPGKQYLIVFYFRCDITTC